MLLLALAATPAVAADPSSGEVSKASPKVTWEGAITSFQSWQTYNQQQGQCIQPSCDTFTLEVKDAAPQLNIVVESGDSGIFVEVVKPDGSKEQFGGPDLKVTAKLKNPPTGSYTINVAQNEQTQATHKGSAELIFPAAAAPAPTTPPSGTTPPAASDTPPVTLSLKAGKRKGKTLPVTIKPSATVTNLKAMLLRGKTVVAKGSLVKVSGSAVLKLKLKGKPKRGKHTLKVTAMDEQGRSVSKTLTVKI